MTSKVNIPFTLDFTVQKCMYCSAPSQCSYRALSLSHGIIACSEHANWAKRDIGAYLHTRRLVKVEKLMERFPQLRNIQNIRIRNSDGRIKLGRLWLSSQRRNGDYVFVNNTEGDGWRIRVAWEPEPDSPHYVMTREMRLSELVIYGVDVEPIITALQEGFYKIDYHEQQTSIIKSQENQDPTLKKNE
jgi:hypothetical protein